MTDPDKPAAVVRSHVQPPSRTVYWSRDGVAHRCSYVVWPELNEWAVVITGCCLPEPFMFNFKSPFIGNAIILMDAYAELMRDATDTFETESDVLKWLSMA